MTSRTLLPVALVFFVVPLFASSITAQARQREDQALEAQVRFLGDALGESLDVDGDVLVAGAPGVGVTGGITVFRRTAGVWAEDESLLASDAATSQEFGLDVGVDGDVIVVGAQGDGEAAPFAGAAYVFRHDGANWIEEQKLIASDAEIGDQFGNAVGIDGDVIVVGASKRDEGLAGAAGAVYVFRHDGAAWIEEQILIAGPEDSDFLGYDVAVHGDVILAGATGEDGSGVDRGAAYVFRHDGAAWQLEDSLAAPDGGDGDWFGLAVSLTDGLAVVGALRHDSAGSNAGAAYLFRHEQGNWPMEQKLLGSDTEAFDFFGVSVAVDGDLVVVGANGDDEAGSSSGAAFLFRWTGSTWVEQAKLTASGLGNTDLFGESVAMEGNTAAAGIPGMDGRGVAAVYSVTGLRLDIQPPAVPSGNPVTLWAGGGVPGSPALLYSLQVNGIPFVQLLLSPSFDAVGRWTITAPTTGIPGGTSVELMMFGVNGAGKVVASGPESLTVQ